MIKLNHITYKNFYAVFEINISYPYNYFFDKYYNLII